MFRSEFNSVCSQFNIFCIQGREKPKNWSAVRDSSTVSQPHREVKVEKRCWRVFWGFYEIYCLFTGDHKPVKKKELWHTSFFINISAPLRFFGSSSAARIKRSNVIISVKRREERTGPVPCTVCGPLWQLPYARWPVRPWWAAWHRPLL